MIKKTLTLVAASALVLVNSASALVWMDNNTDDVFFSGPGYSGPHPIGVLSHTDIFDLTPAFIPGTHVVTSASAVFTFFDEGNSEGFKVTVDSEELFNQGSFAATIELTEATLSGTLIASLNDDGKLTYTITRTSGNFWLYNAKLTAEGDVRPTNGVPDGGATVAMLGLGLLGIFGIRRKLA